MKRNESYREFLARRIARLDALYGRIPDEDEADEREIERMEREAEIAERELVSS